MHAAHCSIVVKVTLHDYPCVTVMYVCLLHEQPQPALFKSRFVTTLFTFHWFWFLLLHKDHCNNFNTYYRVRSSVACVMLLLFLLLIRSPPRRAPRCVGISHIIQVRQYPVVCVFPWESSRAQRRPKVCGAVQVYRWGGLEWERRRWDKLWAFLHLTRSAALLAVWSKGHTIYRIWQRNSQYCQAVQDLWSWLVYLYGEWALPSFGLLGFNRFSEISILICVQLPGSPKFSKSWYTRYTTYYGH